MSKYSYYFYRTLYLPLFGFSKMDFDKSYELIEQGRLRVKQKTICSHNAFIEDSRDIFI